MKQLFKILLLSSLALPLSACSGSGSGNGSGNSPKSTVLVNGKNPRAYFDQFLYKVTGSCEKGDVLFHYLSSDAFEMRTLENGHKVYGQMEIVLIDKENFYGYIEEHEVFEGNLGHYKYQVIAKDGAYGKYSINKDGKLVIPNVGVGSALTYNDRDIVSFEFSNEGISDTQVFFKYVEGSSSPYPGHESFNKYCNR